MFFTYFNCIGFIVCFAIPKGGREHWTVNYIGTQSFIIRSIKNFEDFNYITDNFNLQEG